MIDMAKGLRPVHISPITGLPRQVSVENIRLFAEILGKKPHVKQVGSVSHLFLGNAVQLFALYACMFHLNLVNQIFSPALENGSGNQSSISSNAYRPVVEYRCDTSPGSVLLPGNFRGTTTSV